jgi:hypothetical protein
MCCDRYQVIENSKMKLELLVYSLNPLRPSDNYMNHLL